MLSVFIKKTREVFMCFRPNTDQVVAMQSVEEGSMFFCWVCPTNVFVFSPKLEITFKIRHSVTLSHALHALDLCLSASLKSVTSRGMCQPVGLDLTDGALVRLV